MRPAVSIERLRRFMGELGRASEVVATVYLVGGASALLIGWRDSTIDVDLKLIPDHDSLYRAIRRLKEELEINVELAAPDDFLPALPGWEERSPFIATEGRVTFRHYDFYAQALSKIERGHSRDLKDVSEMKDRHLIEPARLLVLFHEIEPALVRFPAIDAGDLRRRLEAWGG
ncbi:MAG TPA: DUF6036 family nucleotidyltransferase [Thermoanaerobaculia bacterium]|nr:DUF6036 family nucleotidyltransferase [Thermoanaerobaculia bacterium]